MVVARFLENVYVYVGACVCREGWGLVGRTYIM